ncbi:MAG: DUF4190 domain-containing protein [Phycisphaerales bacterium]|nr:DUF4190 domain-containing protein [Phycisphaerales bacterium]
MNAELMPEQPAQNPDTNGLGLASFIISLVGIFSVGILSIIGVVMGAIAMRREPKGFAIAGFVIGLVGLLWGCILGAFLLLVMIPAGIGLGAGIMAMVYSQIGDGIEAMNKASKVITKWQTTHNGSLPSSIDGTAALKAAGIEGVYELIDGDEYELTLTIDENGSPWTFYGEYDEDGDREKFRWKSDDGSSHGTWNWD